MSYRNYSTDSGFIVDPTGNGDFTTIQAAITAATLGKTIFIKPATYTENLTLKAGVNLVSFVGNGLTGSVIILGNSTYTGTGVVSISGIRLQTNGSNLLTVSGSSVSIVNLDNCYLNCGDATGIVLSSSDASSQININSCSGNLGTTGIKYFDFSGAGFLKFQNCYLTNGGASTTASTSSGSGQVAIMSSRIIHPISTSGTSGIFILGSEINTGSIATTSLTVNGTGNNNCSNSTFNAGSASAVSVGAGVTLNLFNCETNSSNANAITGAGTIKFSCISFGDTSQTVNTTTQLGGTIQGSTTANPPSGFLGEQIIATVASGSPVALTDGITSNVTSIALTPGVWDISGVVSFLADAVTGTAFVASLSATSATNGTVGDNRVDSPYPPTASNNMTLTIPSYRVLTSSAINYYLVAFASFSVGTVNVCGRISATRVG